MHIFQIPSFDKTSNDYTIGVIDCSGSMEGNWKWLAEHWNKFIPMDNSKIITFDTQAKIPASNRMDVDIYKHGGGGTNITQGFMKLEQELTKLPAKSNVTVVFISDGEDNNINTLPARMSELGGNDGSYRINFICIGVGPGFPTFISMKLREKYHNGDETLPAIFLIEHISEKAYTIKFEAIRPFLTVGQQRAVAPAVCVFPWREYSTKVSERAWVMTDAEEVEIDGQKMSVKEHYLNLRGINELFRSWNQMINLESLNEGEKVDVRAKKTLGLMDSILEELKDSRGIDIFAKAKDVKFNSIFEKFQWIVNKRNFERTVWYYEDVKKIAAGNTAGGLSDFEAAKRIGLGTIVGKYAQKAFALKKITPAEFEGISKEFLALLESGRPATKEHPHPLRALLTEETLGQALGLVKNQLELFESFPLHGHPCRVIRNDQGQIDPQNVDLRFLGDHTILELTDITLDQGGSINVQTKDGKTETANAVIPLFGADDADLLPFINSRLYKLLLSWSLIRDPDELLDQSFACMLTATFGLALKQNPPNVELMDKVAANLELIRSTIPEGDLFRNAPSAELASLTTELDIEKKQKDAPIGKVLLNAYSHFKAGRLSKDAIERLLEANLAISLKNALKADTNKLKGLFTSEILKKEAEEAPEVAVANKVRAMLPKIRTLGDLGRKLSAKILEATLNADIDIKFNPARVDKLLDGDSVLESFKNLKTVVGVTKADTNDLERLILIASQTKDGPVDLANEEAFVAAKNQVKEALKADLKTELDKAGGHDKAKGKKGKGAAPQDKKTKNMSSNAIYKAVYPQLEKEFRELFKQVHREVLPLSKPEIEEYCKKHGINFKSIQFSNNSLLPIRTCAAPGCHFFMRDIKRLDNHMSVWGVQLPKGFHMMVKENRAKSTKEIYDAFTASHFTVVDGKTVPFDVAKYEKTEEEVLEYIDKLKAAYAKILG